MTDLFTRSQPIDSRVDEARALIVGLRGLALPEAALATHIDHIRQQGWEHGVRCAIAWARRVSPEAAQAIQENLDAELEPTTYGAGDAA